MKTISTLKRCAVVVIMVGFAGTAIAVEEYIPTAEELAADAADAQYLESLATVANNRYGTIAGIVATWEAQLGSSDGWKTEFTAALEAAGDAHLLDIQNADSYETVRAILQWQPAPVSVDGVAGIEALGDLDQDLTYAPVFPCRIFDTRFAGAPYNGVAPVNNEVRDYFTHSTVSGTLADQGGNPDGCPAPRGEPVGVAINLAAVPISPQGHLRVWPYLGTMPTASFLNYTADTNIANAGIVTNCHFCGPDISVFNRNSAHSFADVMGYFYPAQQVPPVGAGTSVEVIADSTCSNVETVTITVPAGGGYVTVHGMSRFHLDKLSGSGWTKTANLFIGTTSTDCTLADFGDGYQHGQAIVDATSTTFIYTREATTQRIFFRDAGTYTFYLNVTGTDDGGPVGETIHTVPYSTMQAHFTAN